MVLTLPVSLTCVVLFFQDAQSYADDNSLLFMETSAKTSMNVNEIFMAIGKIIRSCKFNTGWLIGVLLRSIGAEYLMFIFVCLQRKSCPRVSPKLPEPTVGGVGAWTSQRQPNPLRLPAAATNAKHPPQPPNSCYCNN